MTMIERIANWLTGGEIDRLDDLVVDQQKIIQRQRVTIASMQISQDTTRKNGDVIAAQQATITAQRKALDQIEADLTEMIKARPAFPFTSDIRSIRALTKGPHK